MLELTAHLIAGLLSALSVKVSRVLAIIGFVGFEFYEMAQYFEKGDFPVPETMEFMTGFFIGVSILLFMVLTHRSYLEIKKRISCSE